LTILDVANSKINWLNFGEAYNLDALLQWRKTPVRKVLLWQNTNGNVHRNKSRALEKMLNIVPSDENNQSVSLELL